MVVAAAVSSVCIDAVRIRLLCYRLFVSLLFRYELREQVMSKDKYTDIFSRQIEAIAFITLKIFCNAREKCL